MAASNSLPTIEEWCAAQDRYRVVVPHPKRLRDWAFEYDASEDVVDVFESHIMPHLTPALREAKISCTNIRLIRGSTGQEENMGPNHTNTLLIETTSENFTEWEEPVEELYSHFKKFTKIAPERIEVEIRNPQKMGVNKAANYKSSIVPNDKVLVKAMDTAQRSVIAKIDEYNIEIWSSIACHMRGPLFDEKAPRKPTLLIFVRPRSAFDFGNLQSILLEILGRSEIPLSLEILPDELAWV